ncbi:MAG TPA: hypothetical protein VFP23_06750, partial [Solirubrobacterales bacterium]|nr:hypothetical protein [Solirubrobacterales bacterium]
LRWMSAVALFGMLAYVFTPFSAAGAEGAPVGFAINVRYAIPPLLAALVLLPLVPPKLTPPLVADGTARRSRRAEWMLLGGLLLVLLLTDRPDAILHSPSRLFGIGLAFLFVLIPAMLAVFGRRFFTVAIAALGIAILAIGYPIERSYLRDRFRNDVPPSERIPGMHLDSAYTWARNIKDARIGLAGTTAGFLQYGFYGTDLSNQVRYLGMKGPHGAFNAIPDCRGFRAAVNAAGLDYLVTSPFLNFIHTGRPIPSPEAGWLRGEAAVAPVLRSGPVTVWKVRGRLDPSACGPANAPLRRIPQQPRS